MKLDLALPLFSLIDRKKVDPGKSDLAELAAHLGEHFLETHGIVHEVASIEGGNTSGGSGELYFVMLGVPRESWPAFLALAEVQRAIPFVFRAEPDGRFTLHPLNRNR